VSSIATQSLENVQFFKKRAGNSPVSSLWCAPLVLSRRRILVVSSGPTGGSAQANSGSSLSGLSAEHTPWLGQLKKGSLQALCAARGKQRRIGPQAGLDPVGCESKLS